ncbi:2Fe-2S iron-sulfur cluster-binding protein [Rhizobium yanglingense]
MASYRIALNFEDGVTRFVECRDGEKVLDAAFRNKINLPMDCSDGVCGTCKCRRRERRLRPRRRLHRRCADGGRG